MFAFNTAIAFAEYSTLSVSLLRYTVVTVPVFSKNFGKSQALHAGFERAVGDVVITMDADLQDSPEEIPALFDMIKNNKYDVVSGWKKKRYDRYFAKNLSLIHI